MKPQYPILLMTLLICGSEALADTNLAFVAKASTSYCSGDTSISALNDELEPRNSRDRRRGSYGNWPRTGTQWVQYDWSQPINTRCIDVYWWDDKRGVRLPASARLFFWDGRRFKPVQSQETLAVAGDQYNRFCFTPVTTSKIRLEIDGNERYSTGLLEWKVYDAGRSPAFAPIVVAGTDRSVVLKGKTYLQARIKTLGKPGDSPPSLTWNKRSGPGWVTFANPRAQETTATFTELGEYVLQCTAQANGLSASDTLRVKVVPGPPDKHLRPVDTMAYTLNSPLWSQRAKALIVNWIPHCIHKINDPNLPQGGGSTTSSMPRTNSKASPRPVTGATSFPMPGSTTP